MRRGLRAPLSFHFREDEDDTSTLAGRVLLGQDQLDGFMLAVEQLSGKLGGEAANVLKEDDQAAGNR